MIKLIITDIGGVLVKTDEAIISCIEKVFLKHSIPFGSRDNLLSAFGVSIYDYIKNYLPAGYEDKADFCYDEFKKVYPDHALNLMSVFPFVNETLVSLKRSGVALCVLSCMIRREVDVNLSLLSFDNFDLIFSLDDYLFKRPNPKGLLMIMEKMGVLPSETIYIGDSFNDVRMAKNAGVISVAITTGAQGRSVLEKENPDYIIDSFRELIGIVDGGT